MLAVQEKNIEKHGSIPIRVVFFLPKIIHDPNTNIYKTTGFGIKICIYQFAIISVVLLESAHIGKIAQKGKTVVQLDLSGKTCHKIADGFIAVYRRGLCHRNAAPGVE